MTVCIAADNNQRQAGAQIDPTIFYMKQTIGNACGTIGVLHAIGNNRQTANLRTSPVVRDPSASCRSRMLQHLPFTAGKGSFLDRFFDATAGMNPTEVGAFLEHPPEGAPSIDEAHAVSVWFDGRQG